MIVIVLLLLFILPLTSIDTWVSQVSMHEYATDMLVHLYDSEAMRVYNSTLNVYLTGEQGHEPIIMLSIPDPNGLALNTDRVDYTPLSLSDYRPDEFLAISKVSQRTNFEIVCIYSMRWVAVTESVISISRTVFITVLLALSAVYFVKDANHLVLFPIEKIFTKLKYIAKNPQAACLEDIHIESVELLELINKRKKEDKTLETEILESAITKISHLLALGFGEAGSAIIAQNMNSGGDLDPMIPGQRIHAIFGFCDIRNFTDTTEVLQTKVMKFVNQIAEITHSQVKKYGG